MGIYIIKLPDVGEGLAEAEFVELHVNIGDEVKADDELAAVLTDKATVDITAPASGTVKWIGAEIGEIVPVGSAIFELEIDGEGNSTVHGADMVDKPTTPVEAAPAAAAPVAETPKAELPSTTVSSPKSMFKKPEVKAKSTTATSNTAPSNAPTGDPLASPAIRAAARDRGIDLRYVGGSGPAGRITWEDLDNFEHGGSLGAGRVGEISPNYRENDAIEEIKIIGLRRKIAEKMQASKRNIPHFSYVEEVDVTALEDLRVKINKEYASERGKLTVLPFIMRALIIALRDFPQMNANFDDHDNVVYRYGGAHLGIAAQTDNGLVVPVVHHAETNDLWQNASEIKRLADAARNGTAKREEMMGGSITITSLGPIGGIVTTPVINAPEVAIIGVNKIMTRPVYNDIGNLVPRKLMNISSSFDHRVVDGHDAAEFIQRIKSLLETPAMIFIND